MSASNGPRVRVWDLATRLFHWLLAFSLLGSWLTAELGFDWTEWHMRLGYFALTLLGFRLVWGLVGTRHARFTSFLTGPARFFSHVGWIVARRSTDNHVVGHNPVGGWMVLVLLFLTSCQAVTGLFLSDDIFYAGPYNAVVSDATADTLAAWHRINFNILVGAIGLHIAAIAYYAARGRQLLTPMLTGYVGDSRANPADGIDSDRNLGAFAVFSLVAAAVLLLVWLAPPPKEIGF